MLKELEQEIMILSRQFHEKFNSKEEDKEDELAAQQIEEISGILMNITQRVLSNVTEIISTRSSKYFMKRRQVKFLETRIEELKNQITELDEESEFQKKTEAAKNITALRQRVKDIKEDCQVEGNFQIQIDQQAAVRKIMGLIDIKGTQKIGEPILISPSGNYNIAKRTLEHKYKFDNFSEHCAIFQLNRWLYISGGRREVYHRQMESDAFSRLNDRLELTKLTPMPNKAQKHCLTGQGDSLVSTGGVQGLKQMKIATSFNIKLRIWKRLPSMKYERNSHSSCFVNNTVFCFFGSAKNSIQYLETLQSRAWDEIEFEQKLPVFFPLLAVPFNNEILVFLKDHSANGLLVFNSQGKFKVSLKIQSPNLIDNLYVTTSQCIYASTKMNELYHFRGLEWISED